MRILRMKTLRKWEIKGSAIEIKERKDGKGKCPKLYRAQIERVYIS